MAGAQELQDAERKCSHHGDEKSRNGSGSRRPEPHSPEPRRAESVPKSESRSSSVGTGSVSGEDTDEEEDSTGPNNRRHLPSSRRRRACDPGEDDIEAAVPPSAPPHSPPQDGAVPSTAPEPPSSSSSSSPEAQRTSLQTALIIGALSSALFLSALDVSIITVAIPAIADDFNSTVGYTWIGSAYLLANAATAPSWGKISDIWGRKPILLIAVAVFWVGSLLCAVSTSMPMLIASRAVQGVGGGGIVILVNICISDLFSMRKRGVYFGAMGLVWAVAGGVGPVLGGVFTQTVTWRWCFYVNLPISGLGMAVLAFVLKLHNPRTPMREGLRALDWLGSLTVITGTVMVLLGLTLGGVLMPWSSATVLCLLAVGLGVVALFAVVETWFAAHPLVPMHLFRTRSNVASMAAAFCHGFVFISGSYYLPLYFQSVTAADPLLSGVYVLPFTLTLSLVSVVTGIFIKKTGRYLPCIFFGFVTMTLGFGLFYDLPGPVPLDLQAPNWAKIILYQIVAGIGTGPNFQSPLLALQSAVAQRDIASATATFQFVRQLSTSISVVVGGVVFQNGMETQAQALMRVLPPDVAALLGGEQAAASVGIVADLPGEQGLVAREAFYDSLRTMYIVYTAVSGCGLLVGCFVGSRMLSKDHEEHKTGLKTLARARSRASKEKKKAGGGVMKSKSSSKQNNDDSKQGSVDAAEEKGDIGN